MNEESQTQKHVYQTIDGVEALINLHPGELFLDIPASTPRYIRVREGDQIQEGDVRTQTSQAMKSQTLSKWRVETISEDTVTGVDLETGESQEWDREWLVKHLGSGEFSVELTEFDRVSVSESSGPGAPRGDEERDERSLRVIVSVYGNNGQKFTQVYSSDSDDWESLKLVKKNNDVEEFSEELREKFDAAVTEALELEDQYHR